MSSQYILVFLFFIYFPLDAQEEHGTGKAIFSQSRNPIASFINSKASQNKGHVFGNRKPAFITDSNQVILNGPNGVSHNNQASAAVQSSNSVSNTAGSNYYGQNGGSQPLQVIPITNAEKPKPVTHPLPVYLTAPLESTLLGNPSPIPNSPATTILNGNSPGGYFGSSNHAVPFQNGLQGPAFAQQQAIPGVATLLQQPHIPPQASNFYYGAAGSSNNPNAYNNLQTSGSYHDSNALISQQNDNGVVVTSGSNGASSLYYNGGSAAIQHQNAGYNEQLTSTSQESIFGSPGPSASGGATSLQQQPPIFAPSGNNMYYAAGASGPEPTKQSLSEYTHQSSNDNQDENFFGPQNVPRPVSGTGPEEVPIKDDSDLAYNIFDDPQPENTGISTNGDPSTDFDYVTFGEGEPLYYSEVSETETIDNTTTTTPIPDNPLTFLNLVGTDFQPGRLVNIFFGLFIILFMIIIHGYALWILGIAYLPGTRSLDEWQLDRIKVDDICSLVLDAIDYWEARIG